MHLRDLVRALQDHDTLGARQWVSDAERAKLQLTGLEAPHDLDPVGLAIAAGMVELPASRWQQSPPTWTQRVPALAIPFFLVTAAASMPRLRRLCEEEGPEPLRRRGLLAPPDFLTAA
jgi:hypothetical protein